MKCDHFAPQWRSPLAVLLTLVGLGILLGLTPLPSQANEVVDPADPAANYQDEDDRQEDYQDMNKEDYQNMNQDDYRNADDYKYLDENKLKSENDYQEDYENEDSEDYENMNQINYKNSN